MGDGTGGWLQLYQGERDSLSGKMRSGQNSNEMRERPPRNLENVPGREESRCKALGLQEPLGGQEGEGEGGLEGEEGDRRDAARGRGQGLVATGGSGFRPSVRWGPWVGFEQKSGPSVLRHLGLGCGEGVACWSATDPPSAHPSPG